MQRTLLIVKPDGVVRRLIGKIIARFEDKGLRIVGMKMMRVSSALAKKHYAEHKGKSFYPCLINFITSGPVVVFVVEGVEAIAICRKMMGATFGPEAAPGTIRGDFGASRSNNLIHGSDSPKSAKREIALYFKSSELIKYSDEDYKWIYNYSEGNPV